MNTRLRQRAFGNARARLHPRDADIRSAAGDESGVVFLLPGEEPGPGEFTGLNSRKFHLPRQVSTRAVAIAAKFLSNARQSNPGLNASPVQEVFARTLLIYLINNSSSIDVRAAAARKIRQGKGEVEGRRGGMLIGTLRFCTRGKSRYRSIADGSLIFD